jgi:hypothetical protein
MGIRNGTHFYLENSSNGPGEILSGKNKKINLLVCVIFCITFTFQQIRKTMTTTIKLSPNNKTYEIWYTNNGTDYKLHKKGITSIDDAIKETTIIKGGIKLLRDLCKK